MKGQLLSMDFLAAVLIITISLGLFTQTFEASQKNAAEAKLAVNPAETIAEQMTYLCKTGVPVPVDPAKPCALLPAFCYRFYYNETVSGTLGYADAFGTALPSDEWAPAGCSLACANVFAARRLVGCPFPVGGSNASACLLEVKTC